MKKIIITVTVCLILIAIGGAGYWQYTIRKPEYSLWQAKKAIDEHDLMMFEKYVDTEGVVETLIDQFMDVCTENIEKEGGKYDKFGMGLVEGFVTLFKPRFTKLVKQEIVSFVETGDFEKENKNESQKLSRKEDSSPEFSLENVWKNSGGGENRFQGIKYVKEEGKIAYIGLKFFSKKYEQTFIINFKMRGMDNYWQVAEITNLFDIMKELGIIEGVKETVLPKPEKTLGIEGKSVPDKGLPELRVTLVNVGERFVKGGTAESIMVVEGSAVNANTLAVSNIRVRGKILDSSGKVLFEEESNCGTILTDDELKSLTRDEIKKELSNPYGRDVHNADIKPGAGIPFMLVFTMPSEDASDLVVELIGIEAAKSK